MEMCGSSGLRATRSAGARSRPRRTQSIIVRRESAKRSAGLFVFLLLVPVAGRRGGLIDAALAQCGQRLVGRLFLRQGLLQQPVRIGVPSSWA